MLILMVLGLMTLLILYLLQTFIFFFMRLSYLLKKQEIFEVKYCIMTLTIVEVTCLC